MHGQSHSCDRQASQPAGLPPFLTALADGVLLAVKVQPRAARSEIAGVLGAELRIKVTAPPVDAAANEALLRLLGETLDCPRNRIELLRGHTSRHKVLKLHGADARVVAARLTAG
ncbi:MAG TPA: DUF167 domain-containing protein [Verrucomicrobiae bacterium]|nr:DUF167 domain-containing protein [Verrucomicrobiae bacterium]